MKSNLTQIQEWIGVSEGGYVNHPSDPGGATDRGITQTTYDSWNRRKGIPVKTVKGISKQEAEEIIYYDYFLPVAFDQLPSGLDYAMVDYSVNSGPSRASKELQTIVGTTPDGKIGPKTLAAVMKYNPADLVVKLCDKRLTFLKSLSIWKVFGKGWASRVALVKERSLALTKGATKL